MLGVIWSLELSLQPTLAFPACVAWRRILLQDVVSSSSHPFQPWKHYLLEALDVGLTDSLMHRRQNEINKVYAGDW